jgi:hypothetical protein
MAHSKTNQSLQVKIDRLKVLEKRNSSPQKKSASPSKKGSFGHVYHKKNVPSYE